MKIFLVRHGTTDVCLESDKTINKNVELNQAGIEQIKRLNSRVTSFTRIYTSPTIRTVQTSEILRQSYSVPVVVDQRLLNKESSDSIYEENIKSFLSDIINANEDIVVVTHGRIVKMFYSIVQIGYIDETLTDKIKLDYGTLNIIEFINGKFQFTTFNEL